MIRVFKSDDVTAFALFDLKTKKFKYGEICSTERLRAIINHFHQHDVEINISKSATDELEELFYVIPHLTETAKVIKLPSVDPERMLAKASKIKKPRSYTLSKICLGIILGLLVLIPTSNEYKSSVLRQAEVVEKMAQDFKENKPEWKTQTDLYYYVKSLYKVVNVETITYKDASYSVVFSSQKKNLKASQFKNFKGATLTKVSTIKNTEGIELTIYKLEGTL